MSTNSEILTQPLFVLTTVPTLIKKKNNFFPIYKEIKSGAVAKSYMRKGFPIYEEMRKFLPYMRRPLIIYDFAPDPSECSYIFEENFIFFFISETAITLCGEENSNYS